MDDVMGDVMGDDDFETAGFSTVGRGGRRRGGTLRLPPRPGWRDQLAPGVAQPGEGLEQLPLEPSAGGGIFTSTLSFIEWRARPQRPFRGERILAIVAPFGTTAAGAIPVIRPGIFVGTQLVGAQLGDTPLGAFNPTAFGVRMVMFQATPGMDISMPIALIGTALAPGDTITVSITIFGRTVR